MQQENQVPMPEQSDIQGRTASRKIFGLTKIWFLLAVVFLVAGSVVANAFFRQQAVLTETTRAYQDASRIANGQLPMFSQNQPASLVSSQPSDAAKANNIANVAIQNRQISSEEQSLESRVQQLIAYIAQRPNPLGDSDKTRIQTELKSLLNQMFDLRHKQQSGEITRLEKELAAAKALHQKRSDRREEIIERRFNQLLGNTDDLNWDTKSNPNKHPPYNPGPEMPSANYGATLPGGAFMAGPVVYAPSTLQPNAELNPVNTTIYDSRSPVPLGSTLPQTDVLSNQLPSLPTSERVSDGVTRSNNPLVPMESLPSSNVPIATDIANSQSILAASGDLNSAVVSQSTFEPVIDSSQKSAAPSSSTTANRSLVEAAYSYKQAILALRAAKTGDVQAKAQRDRCRAVWNTEKMQTQFNHDKCKLMLESLTSEHEVQKALYERGSVSVTEIKKVELALKLAQVEYAQTKIGIELSETLAKEIEELEKTEQVQSKLIDITGQITLKESRWQVFVLI